MNEKFKADLERGKDFEQVVLRVLNEH